MKEYELFMEFYNPAGYLNKLDKRVSKDIECFLFDYLYSKEGVVLLSKVKNIKTNQINYYFNQSAPAIYYKELIEYYFNSGEYSIDIPKIFIPAPKKISNIINSKNKELSDEKFNNIVNKVNTSIKKEFDKLFNQKITELESDFDYLNLKNFYNTVLEFIKIEKTHNITNQDNYNQLINIEKKLKTTHNELLSRIINDLRNINTSEYIDYYLSDYSDELVSIRENHYPQAHKKLKKRNKKDKCK